MGQLKMGSKSNPVIFQASQRTKEKLAAKYRNLSVIDSFETWVKESFIVNNPKFKLDPNFTQSIEFQEFCKKNSIDDYQKSGFWVLYQWKNEMVHLLPEKLHYQVLTARNKNLINDQDQENYYQTKIGIAGLSVGQSAALTIVTTGGGRVMNLADFDRLEATNLNRIKATVSEINDFKCDIVAKQIYSINPFAKLNLFYEGITTSNIDSFVKNLDIVVDEIDNFQIKALLRSKSKEKKIPLISAFDTADGVVLDVERYDIEKNQSPFFGNISKEEFDSLLKQNPDPREIPKLVSKTMGKETIPDLFKASIVKVGSELAGVPQLGSTAFFAGATVAFAVKMIASGSKLQGRYYLDLRNLTGLGYESILSDTEKKFFDKLVS